MQQQRHRERRECEGSAVCLAPVVQVPGADRDGGDRDDGPLRQDGCHPGRRQERCTGPPLTNARSPWVVRTTTSMSGCARPAATRRTVGSSARSRGSARPALAATHRSAASPGSPWMCRIPSSASVGRERAGSPAEQPLARSPPHRDTKRSGTATPIVFSGSPSGARGRPGCVLRGALRGVTSGRSWCAGATAWQGGAR